MQSISVISTAAIPRVGNVIRSGATEASALEPAPSLKEMLPPKVPLPKVGAPKMPTESEATTKAAPRKAIPLKMAAPKVPQSEESEEVEDPEEAEAAGDTSEPPLFLDEEADRYPPASDAGEEVDEEVEEDFEEEEFASNGPTISMSAIREAMEAEEIEPRKHRILKLVTIAAGLLFSTLAVLWSMHGSPFGDSDSVDVATETTLQASGATRPGPAAETRGRTSQPTTAPSVAATSKPAAATAGEREPAIERFINSLEIHLVVADESPQRVLVQNVSYNAGALLHPRHGVRLSHVDASDRTVYFKDAEGVLYDRSY